MPRDDFSAKTKDILAKRVAYCCSNPNCGIKTVGPNSDSKSFTNIRIAAHITAASEGGPRYNRFLTQGQRSSEMNGIWLCQNCAHLIDVDDKQYPETLLRKWKQITENNTYTQETCFCYGWELAFKIQSDIGFLPERTIEFFLEKKHDNSTVDNVRHFMKKIFFLPALKIPVITMKEILNFFIIGCGFGRYSTVLFRKRFIRRLGE